MASQIPEDALIDIEGIGGRKPKQKKLRYVNEIAEARMREIFEGSYKILHEQYDLKMITAGLTMTGGASLLKNSDVLAEEIFNMSAKIGYPNLSDLSGPTERLENPKYATSVGILYYAYSELASKESKVQSIKIGNSFTKIINKIKEIFKDYI